MTPGLAGFIAEGSEPQTWDDTIAAALAALAAEFGVVPERAAGEHGGTRRTTWLDTFDWRLHKAGLTLEYTPGRGGSELRLSGHGGEGTGAGEELTQPVAGWQSTRPHLLPDLPDGPVTRPHRRPGRAARPASRRRHDHRDRRVPAAELRRQDRRQAAHRVPVTRRRAAGRA